MATPAQIKAIWALSRKRGLTREQLYETAGVAHLSTLDYTAAAALIDRLGGCDQPRPKRNRASGAGVPARRRKREPGIIAPASKLQRGLIRDLLCQVTLVSTQWPKILAEKWNVHLTADLEGPLSTDAAHKVIGGLQAWIRNNLERALREATS